MLSVTCHLVNVNRESDMTRIKTIKKEKNERHVTHMNRQQNMEKRLTCCENRQKNWYKNCGVIKHTFYKIKHKNTQKKEHLSNTLP